MKFLSNVHLTLLLTLLVLKYVMDARYYFFQVCFHVRTTPGWGGYVELYTCINRINEIDVLKTEVGWLLDSG